MTPLTLTAPVAPTTRRHSRKHPRQTRRQLDPARSSAQKEEGGERERARARERERLAEGRREKHSGDKRRRSRVIRVGCDARRNIYIYILQRHHKRIISPGTASEATTALALR